MSRKSSIATDDGKKPNFFFRHLDLTIIIVTAALLATTNISLYLFSKKQVKDSARAIALSKIEQIDSHISDVMERVETTTGVAMEMVVDNLEYPEEMLNITRKVVANDTCIMGCSIVFRPDYFLQYGKFFEPYSYRKNPEINDSILSVVINDHDYTTNANYQKNFKTGKSLWSDPYYGKESGRNIFSYSKPFYDEAGNFVGCIVTDVLLEWLNDIMEKALPYPSAFSVIADARTKKLFLSSAKGDEQKLTNRILKDVLPDSTGSFAIESSFSPNRLVVYAPISSTKWSMAISITNHDLLGNLRSTTWTLVILNALILILLGLIFNRVVKTARRRRLERENARIIQNELQIANKIQAQLLPKEFLLRDDINIAGIVTPAKEVAGDLIDYMIRDEKLFFCVGDVSGKGTPAALLMAVTISYFRAFSSRESSPSKIMEAINSIATKGNEENMFVTLFIGVLDLPTGRLRYCNAGHNAPLLIYEGCKEIDVESNLPVGVLGDFKFAEQQVVLPSSATLLLYTDGVTEAVNSNNELYGIERLIAACDSTLLPKELIFKIGDDLNAFEGGSKQADDITILALRYTRNDDGDSEEIRVEMTSDINQITRLEGLCNSLRDKFSIEQQLATRLNVALEEAVSNVILYGFNNNDNPKNRLSVSARKSSGKIIIKIVDNARAFDPTATAAPDTTLDADERPIGGLGIYLIRQIMDTVNYERIDNQNILTITKKL
ncbi:MAG: SpoIIE family protein phosphatase [Muribaculaceae bacterium]|nr:SpoIIE family protein phosphatase [Muribaculaceae bacterium]